MIKKINNLFNDNRFKKYVSNISWLLIEKLFKIFVGLFIGIWIARYLGPTQFGLLSYAQSFVGFFGAIAALGFDSVLVRELVKNSSLSKDFLGTAFILKLIATLFSILLLYFISIIVNDKYENMLIMIISISLIFKAFNVIDIFFQSKVISKYSVYSNIFALFVSSIVKILLIFFKAPLIAFVFVIVFETFLVSISYLYWYLKVSGEFFFKKIKFNFNIAKNLLKSGLPLLLSSMAVALYMRVDQIMIQNMIDSRAVGNYAVAVKLSEVFYFFPGIIVNSLFPSVITAKKMSDKLYYERFKFLFMLVFVICLISDLIIVVFGKDIIDLLYGEKYLDASKVLIIHIWTGIFVSLGLVSGKWYIIENLENYLFFRTVLGLILNIILNLFLIPILNIEGAAIATLISQIFVGYFFDLFFSKTQKLFFIKTQALLFKDFKEVLKVLNG